MDDGKYLLGFRDNGYIYCGILCYMCDSSSPFFLSAVPPDFLFPWKTSTKYERIGLMVPMESSIDGECRWNIEIEVEVEKSNGNGRSFWCTVLSCVQFTSLQTAPDQTPRGMVLYYGLTYRCEYSLSLSDHLFYSIYIYVTYSQCLVKKNS
jgi:hypothetical protein